MKYTINLEVYAECKPLVEQASALIKAGKTPHIKTAGVPFSARSKQPFKNYRTKMIELFRDSGYAVGTCLHEAAHAVRMEEDGIPNCRFIGPGILYNRENRMLLPYGAAIEPGEEPGRTVDLTLIFERTTQLAVGGVALQKYAGIVEVSDKRDYDDFAAKYATMPLALRREEPGDLWKRAQQNASIWLDNPEVKSKIFARVPDYLVSLYS